MNIFRRPSQYKHGFTLVELSIVLVILGLLVGGIMAGQSLIRAAELRSIGNDFNRYQTAYTTFKDKYFAVPGDMSNAISFWGAADPTPYNCRQTSSVGTATCNGNSNNILDSVDGVTYSENFHFWIQLADAGFIEGKYTGISPDINVHMNWHVPGQNCPAGRIANTGYSALTGPGWMAPVVKGRNILSFGAAVVYDWTWGGIINGSEAWNIDTKLDDGLPSTGKISTTYWGTGLCTSGSGYRMTSTGQDCNLQWTLN